VADIIEAIVREGVGKPSKIMVEANLSYDRMNKYLSYLVNNGLLEFSQLEGVYVVTDMGLKFLDEFKRFERFARAFGLEL
jgi:predicted transcriptional regulator